MMGELRVEFCELILRARLMKLRRYPKTFMLPNCHGGDADFEKK